MLPKKNAKLFDSYIDPNNNQDNQAWSGTCALHGSGGSAKKSILKKNLEYSQNPGR